MTNKIAIIVDSGSDVPQEIIDSNNNIRVIPLAVTIEGKDYQDGVDITTEEFYKVLETLPNLPVTASPAPNLITKIIEELFAAGYSHIIGITISSELSATHQTFKLAADEFDDGKIVILDSKSIGIGSGLMAVYASRLINQSFEFEEIIKNVQQSILKSHVYFYIPTLKYLQAGGRIGKVSGFVGSALNIKPIISTNQAGVLDTKAKARSEEKAIKKIVELILNDADGQKVTIGVAHGQNTELSDRVSELIYKQSGHKVDFQGGISPALGVHAGPGLIGVGVQIDTE